VRASALTSKRVIQMSDHKLVLDFSDLAVESIEVVPASSLDSATDGHGMTELAASCDGVSSCGCSTPCGCTCCVPD
jgi:hypothetical protein